MAVVRGVLKSYSAGGTISSAGTHVIRWGSGYKEIGQDPQAGWVQREFIDIGDTRIRNVLLMPYHNALLEESVGQEVAVSVSGGGSPDSARRKKIVAVRTARGVDKPPAGSLVVGAIREIFFGWIVAAFLLFFAGAVALNVGTPAIVLWVALAAYLLARPFIGIVRVRRVWAAL
jgi:hypothetical protein